MTDLATRAVEFEKLEAARAKERVKRLSKRERQVEMATFLGRVARVSTDLYLALLAVRNCETLAVEVTPENLEALDHLEGLIRREYKKTFGVDFGGVPDA